MDSIVVICIKESPEYSLDVSIIKAFAEEHIILEQHIIYIYAYYKNQEPC